jgi:hypothetical protein
MMHTQINKQSTINLQLQQKLSLLHIFEEYTDYLFENTVVFICFAIDDDK